MNRLIEYEHLYIMNKLLGIHHVNDESLIEENRCMKTKLSSLT